MDKNAVVEMIKRGESKSLGLNKRQIAAVRQIKEKKGMLRKEYEELNNISKRTAIRDLNELIDAGVLRTVGTTDDKRYLLSLRHSCQTRAKIVPKLTKTQS